VAVPARSRQSGADLTFGEFRQAAAVMNQYNATQNPVDLRALCAILYRKPVKEKGCALREPFRLQYMGRYMGLVRDMPEWIQWVFMPGLLTSVITCLSGRLSLKGWRFALRLFLSGTGKVRRLNLVLSRI
jgi:hypothetical protein